MRNRVLWSTNKDFSGTTRGQQDNISAAHVHRPRRIEFAGAGLLLSGWALWQQALARALRLRNRYRKQK